jgi:hypothetical protein
MATMIEKLRKIHPNYRDFVHPGHALPRIYPGQFFLRERRSNRNVLVLVLRFAWSTTLRAIEIRIDDKCRLLFPIHQNQTYPICSFEGLISLVQKKASSIQFIAPSLK